MSRPRGARSLGAMVRDQFVGLGPSACILKPAMAVAPPIYRPFKTDGSIVSL